MHDEPRYARALVALPHLEAPRGAVLALYADEIFVIIPLVRAVPGQYHTAAAALVRMPQGVFLVTPFDPQRVRHDPACYGWTPGTIVRRADTSHLVVRLPATARDGIAAAVLAGDLAWEDGRVTAPTADLAPAIGWDVLPAAPPSPARPRLATARHLRLEA